MATVQQELPLPVEERPGDRGAFVHTAFVGAGLVAAVVMMWAIYVFAPEWVAVMLLDIHRSTYPITIQTFEWLAFGFCLGELAVRVLDARADRAQLRLGLLPTLPDRVVKAVTARLAAGGRTLDLVEAPAEALQTRLRRDHHDAVLTILPDEPATQRPRAASRNRGRFDVPSGARMDCGVSIMNSNTSERAGNFKFDSNASSRSAIAAD